MQRVKMILIQAEPMPMCEYRRQKGIQKTRQMDGWQILKGVNGAARHGR